MWGYALQAGKTLGDIVQQTIDSVNQLPDMGKAAIGTGLLVLIGLISVGPVRAADPVRHLVPRPPADVRGGVPDVLAPALHRQRVRVEPAAKTVWYALYGSVTALVVWYRILTPVRLNLRHRMRVEAVIEETPGIVSVLIRGREAAPDGRGGGAVLPLALPGPRACGSAPTRTRCRRRPAPTCCGSP